MPATYKWTKPVLYSRVIYLEPHLSQTETRFYGFFSLLLYYCLSSNSVVLRTPAI